MKPYLLIAFLSIVCGAIAGVTISDAKRTPAPADVPKGALMGTMDGNKLYYFLDNENGNVVYALVHGGKTSVTSQPMEKNDAPCTH